MTGIELRRRLDRLGRSYTELAPLLGLSITGLHKQMRGERAEVVLQQSVANQPGTITGAIMGIERQKQPSKDGALDAEMLTLWCAEGVRAVKLSDIQRLRFLNSQIENEFRRALDTLALSHETGSPDHATHHEHLDAARSAASSVSAHWQMLLKNPANECEPYPHHEDYQGSEGEDQGQLTSHLPGSTPFFEKLDVPIKWQTIRRFLFRNQAD